MYYIIWYAKHLVITINIPSQEQVCDINFLNTYNKVNNKNQNSNRKYK